MNIVSELINGVKQRQQEISESLVNGNCVNFESYFKLVGIHQGLSESLMILDDLLKEKDDEL